MTRSIPIDVTDALRAEGHLTGDDFNPEDRVFEFEGELVKVKTWREPEGQHGVEVFRLSGSIVGANGKAQRRDDGAPALAAFGRHVTVQNFAATDLAQDVEQGRFDCVVDTVRAERNYRAAGALTGAALRGSAARPPELRLLAPPSQRVLP